MKIQNKKGFTLIELLVVITIMGILATGATAVYTSQIQKARDATRINDMNTMRSGVEMVYQDKGAYPNTGAAISGTMNLPGFIDIKTYNPKLNADPKTGQKSANSNFDYSYGVASDANAIIGQSYELSTHLENSGNLTEKAGKDGGTDANRYEVGISVATIGTAINYTGNITSWIGLATPDLSTKCVAFNLGTTVASGQTPGACSTSASLTTANAQTLIIK